MMNQPQQTNGANVGLLFSKFEKTTKIRLVTYLKSWVQRQLGIREQSQHKQIKKKFLIKKKAKKKIVVFLFHPRKKGRFDLVVLHLQSHLNVNENHRWGQVR